MKLKYLLNNPNLPPSQWDLIPCGGPAYLPKSHKQQMKFKSVLPTEDLIETIITSDPPLVDNVVIDKSGNITHPIWLKAYLKNNSK